MYAWAQRRKSQLNASVYFSDYSLFSVSFSGLLTAKNMVKEIDKKAKDLQINTYWLIVMLSLSLQLPLAIHSPLSTSFQRMQVWSIMKSRNIVPG